MGMTRSPTSRPSFGRSIRVWDRSSPRLKLRRRLRSRSGNRRRDRVLNYRARNNDPINLPGPALNDRAPSQSRRLHLTPPPLPPFSPISQHPPPPVNAQHVSLNWTCVVGDGRLPPGTAGPHDKEGEG